MTGWEIGFNVYTERFNPHVVIGTTQDQLAVRSDVEEILASRLPRLAGNSAQMIIRGTDISVPLTFERIQPYVSPKN